jgi:hypothetical protein
MTTMTVNDAIHALNHPALTGVQRFMLIARIQRAAKLGDTDAQRFVALCELNVETATRH